ncbi:MAG: T9SS type A sorting domain-containing protein [Bacteroidia bacterium]
MRNFFSSAVLMVLTLSMVQAQDARPQIGKIGLKKVIHFSNEAPDYDPSVQQIEKIPAPAGDYELKKQYLDSLRKAEGKKSGFREQKTAAPAPALGLVFNGNVSSGTPNDNDMCIGNNGFVISVVNSTLFVYDSTGKVKKTGSLAFFAKELGTLDRSFDPRVSYDPNHDRYIAVFLNGSTSATNTPIVAFSQSNDPTGAWNFYQLPGNPYNDTSWSDYPIISLSGNDLFLTLNLLQDDKGWKDGFRQSIIWQMDLADGYTGDSIDHILWDNITYQGKPVWSICPSQGGMKPEGTQSYFLSVRPGDLSNDSLFVHTISNSVASGSATLTTKYVHCSQPYGLPPSAEQPDGQLLETNDARVLTAMHQNGLIHFAGNTRDFQNNASGIYYGVVDPTLGDAKLTILSYDTLDLGYPDIAYAGSGKGDDHTVILTVSHVSPNTFPGTSVVLMNYSGQFSPLTRVKMGLDNIDVLVDTFERWGDYSGIQRKYNEDRAYWLSGNYGDRINRTTIARVSNLDPTLSIPATHTPSEVILYPNPSVDYFEVEFELEQKQDLRFRVIDLQGKEITILHEERVKSGTNRFRFATTPLPAGTYLLVIESGTQNIHTERFVVVR